MPFLFILWNCDTHWTTSWLLILSNDLWIVVFKFWLFRMVNQMPRNILIQIIKAFLYIIFNPSQFYTFALCRGSYIDFMKHVCLKSTKTHYLMNNFCYVVILHWQKLIANSNILYGFCNNWITKVLKFYLSIYFYSILHCIVSYIFRSLPLFGGFSCLKIFHIMLRILYHDWLYGKKTK